MPPPWAICRWRSIMPAPLTDALLGPEHPDVATSLDSLGNLLHVQGDYAPARVLLERALAIRERALGPGPAQHLVLLGRELLGELEVELLHGD